MSVYKISRIGWNISKIHRNIFVTNKGPTCWLENQVCLSDKTPTWWKRSIVYAWGSADGSWTGHLASELVEKRYEDHMSGAISIYRPKIVSSLVGTDIVDVACGQGCSFFVTKQGEVYATGVGKYGQLGLGPLKEVDAVTPITTIQEPVVACASGDRHTLFVTENGHVYTCGYGKRGELGLGTTEHRVDRPTLIESLANMEKIKKVTAGHGFSVALSESGKVYTFGSANDGRLGHGEMPGGIFAINTYKSSRTMEKIPRLVKALEKERVVSISCGSGHVFAIDEQGVVYGWGNGNNYCFGISDELNVAVPMKLDHLSTSWQQVVSGGAHTLGLDCMGRVWSWGVDHFGCLGVDSSQKSLGEPILVEKLGEIAQGPIHWIAAGWLFSMAVDSKGYVYSWGRGHAGALGVGNGDDQWLPMRVVNEEEQPLRASRIYCGYNYAIAVV
eukprot:jgi/Galph1/3718/GphlegSOOS_G2406.1